MMYLLQELKIFIGNKYDYSKVNYKNTMTNVKIVCPLHGIFEQRPHNHIILKQGCSYCSGKKKHTIETVKEKLNQIHLNKYIYNFDKYINNKQVIEIVCPDHGTFLQKVNTHMSGHGCPSCKTERSGWTRLKFKNHCLKNNNGLGIFYIIQCFNETEEFYKIGITSRSIQVRYSSQRDMPYSYKICQEIEGDPLVLWDFERELKNYFKSIYYRPLKDFPGSKSECFKLLE